MKFVTLSPLAAFCLLAASCVSGTGRHSDYLAGLGPVNDARDPGKTHPPPAIPDDVSYWDGDNVPGAPSIRISRPQQRAYFYKGGTLVGVSLISSGKEGHNTPNGHCRIQVKDEHHESSLYGVFKDKTTNMTTNDNADIREPLPPNNYFVHAPMPYFMQVMPGIGMHTGYLPGYSASHGCIRMPDYMAKKFFSNVQVGTPVDIE
jgi:hypothetical protein